MDHHCCLERALELPQRGSKLLCIQKHREKEELWFDFVSLLFEIMTSTVREGEKHFITKRALCDLWPADREACRNVWIFWAVTSQQRISFIKHIASEHQAVVGESALWPIFMIYAERLLAVYCLFAFCFFQAIKFNANFKWRPFVSGRVPEFKIKSENHSSSDDSCNFETSY